MLPTHFCRICGILTFPPHLVCYWGTIIEHVMHGNVMRYAYFIMLTAVLLPLPCGLGALAQAPNTAAPNAAVPNASAPRIEWEVKHRFRLFRSEADFQRHVAATRNDGVLGAERRLEMSSDGRGWARDVVERLCVDRTGRLVETCDRDGTRE